MKGKHNMKLHISLFLGVLLLAALASAVPIFPTQTDGTYTSTVVAGDVAVDADGNPTQAATASIGIVLISFHGYGTVLACVPATPNETVIINYTVPKNGGRQKAGAFAYSQLGCNPADPLKSEPSENTAYYDDRFRSGSAGLGL